MVVVDIEDSTHVSAKSEAREKLLQFDFQPIVDAGLKLGIRVNRLSSFDGIDDLKLLEQLYGSGNFALDHVFIPKVSHQNEVKIYRSLFDSLPFQPKIYTFIETVEAVENAEQIAQVSDALCFGEADLVAGMYSPNETYINYARAKMCIAAAQENIPAIDSNSFEITDMEIFHEQCLASKSYGFTGKSAIHPKHVNYISKVFSVSEETILKYQSSIDAYYGSTTGFVIDNGEVIAPPFIAKAEKMLKFYRSN
jgi:citrate lyase subunit beta/citryl-CoA lyase/(S)-citramalyl-CoA lyase